MVLATLLSNESDAVCITHQSPMTSFDWSDFPCVRQFNPDDEEFVNFSSNTTITRRAFEPRRALEHKLSDNDLYESSYQRLPSLAETFGSSLSSIDSTCSSSSTSSDVDDLCSDTTTRRVSFAPRVEVREYDIVIGDHPSCDLLPLSLGWTYSDTTFQDYTCEQTRRRPMKLTYLQRKNLLRQVGGYSEEELQSSPKNDCRNTLHHVPTTTQLTMFS